MKTGYTEEKGSEDNPITFGWTTKNRHITRAVKFSRLLERDFYASGSVISRGCFIKAITWNFHAESHFL